LQNALVATYDEIDYPHDRNSVRLLSAREKRLLIYLGALVAILGWDVARHRWSPDVVEETEHYVIYSTATPLQTEEIAQVAEIVYIGYHRLADRFECDIHPHPKLKIKLFKDREEFRHCNHVRDWAEAFYHKPYCYQYYSADEVNPYHWMMHEATHQLNAEAAHLDLPQWLDEGIACYISTSRIIDDALVLGKVDTNTYPVWWLDLIATSGDLDRDKAVRTIIPLRQIVSGRGGPSIDEHVNLYYLHWWTLAHFLIEGEDGKYREGFARLLAGETDLPAFEKHIGSIESVEKSWYEHVLGLKEEFNRYGTPPVRLKSRTMAEEEIPVRSE
jgi:hypothetical protein